MKQNTVPTRFTIVKRPSDGRYQVFDSGKFRRDFASLPEAQQFVHEEEARTRKPVKGTHTS